jgi:hypothetical protein
MITGRRPSSPVKYKDSNECDLSDKSASDVGGLKTVYDGNPYDHDARCYCGGETTPY